jgi:pyruvate dehydrogenase E2 component (dihydrolipoamide acetyltransferase)
MAQDTGKIVKWLKSEGDEVQKGEAIMEVETDKVTVEIEAQGSGTLASVSASEGEDVPVGQVIAYLLEPGESAPEVVTPAKPQAEAASPQPTSQPTPAPVAAADGPISATPVAARIAAEHGIDLQAVKPEGGKVSKSDVESYLHTAQVPHPGDGKILASPKARRIAAERGINLALVRGTGPEGAVLTEDILAIDPASLGAAAPETIALSTPWRVMADRITQSWTQTPHFYLVREVNASRMVQWREGVLPQASIRISYTDILVKLVAAALRKHPRLNASWAGDTIRVNPDINIGLAVAVEEGLIVPVIHQADQLSLEEIAYRRDDIVKRANAGGLLPEDIQGGTFTITNLGMYGIDVFNAVINPPEAAILAVGRILERVLPVDGQPSIQPVMMLSISFDHRVVDGARGAEFIQTLVGLIEEPLALLL